YNPLFVYGESGLGKTHLLHAIGHYAQHLFDGARVRYVSSEEFTNDFINSIRDSRAEGFRRRYRDVDILLVDDIQFLEHKEGTQEEFFHTFNTLHSNGKQLVISSDRPPRALVTLEERLRSRFEWGLIADIQPPDLETRIAILRAKAEGLAVRVPDDVMEFIARQIQSNIRELEGALNRVVAYAQLMGLPLTMEVATSALADLLPRRKSISIDRIIEVVADFYGVPAEALRGPRRNKELVYPRQVAMYLAREETGASLPQIGEAFGGRDHTTVLYGIEKVQSELEHNERLRREIMALRERLYREEKA
ncbi:MAG: chromosomal replication initiator protein DnaA, partial [Thermoflexus sp.]